MLLPDKKQQSKAHNFSGNSQVASSMHNPALYWAGIESPFEQ
jgi:hypothetical protein